MAQGRDLVLAVDTTGEHCSAALFDAVENAVLSQDEPLIGKGHAERLMEIVARVLGAGGCTYRDLTRIAVAVGPGSFTGIRVGISAARGWALALGIPAVGVDVLEALAEPHRDGPLAVLAVQDARRGEVYAALHAPGGERLRGPAALAPAALPDLFAARPMPDGLLLTGSGADIAASHLADTGIDCRIGPERATIGALARIGAFRPAGAPARPLYLRSADAKPQVPAGLVRHGRETPVPGVPNAL